MPLIEWRNRFKTGYEDLDFEHHKQLLEDIREMMERFESGAYENHETEMAAHLQNWFTRHFQGPDARLETLAR